MEHKATFTNVGRVNFCEQINRRYFMGVTLIDDMPYTNMGAEFYAEGTSTWHPDVKKNISCRSKFSMRYVRIGQRSLVKSEKRWRLRVCLSIYSTDSVDHYLMY